MVRVAINGFGRIGRTFLRTTLSRNDLEVVAINDIAPIEVMAHLFKYDSIHGITDADVSFENQDLIINGSRIAYSTRYSLDDLNWRNVDIVIEATGKFKDKSQLSKHLDAGASKVILSAPPIDDDIKTIVLGVNEEILETSDLIVSNASCTTNNAAPLIKVVKDLCGIENAYISTVHSYTSDQSLHDQPHRDLRRARAAAQSIIPTTTGAAKALTKVFPDLSNVIGGCGIRVPVPNGSLTDMTINVEEVVSIEQVNKAFYEYAAKNNTIMEYTDLPYVSKDIAGSPYSCVFDSSMTSVIGKMVKLIGWYDNETGYSNRLADLSAKISTL